MTLQNSRPPLRNRPRLRAAGVPSRLVPGVKRLVTPLGTVRYRWPCRPLSDGPWLAIGRQVRPPSNAGYTAIEMMVVMSLMGLLTAMSVPSMSAMLGYYRLSGDIRSVSNTVAVAKTRAAAAFTRGRLYVDLTSGDYHVETWRKSGTPGWVAEGSYGSLSVGNIFGLASMDTPPPNTQTVIGLSPECLDDDGAALASTACVVFNSRGIPVDAADVPTGAGGLYVTDNAAVYAVTIAATGLTRVWRAQAAEAVWVRQ